MTFWRKCWPQGLLSFLLRALRDLGKGLDFPAPLWCICKPINDLSFLPLYRPLSCELGNCLLMCSDSGRGFSSDPQVQTDAKWQQQRQKVVQIFRGRAENALSCSVSNTLTPCSEQTELVLLQTSKYFLLFFFFYLADLWSFISSVVIRSVNPSYFPFSKESALEAGVEARGGKDAVSPRLLGIQWYGSGFPLYRELLIGC